MAFLNKLCIDEYRGIRNLKIDKLKKINLIVGDNNCGKTSVLEAVEFLRTSGNLANAYRIARQRNGLSAFYTGSAYESFIYMFPKNNRNDLSITVFGICNDKEIAFRLNGQQGKILLDTKELPIGYIRRSVQNKEIETDSFEGDISLKYGNEEKNNHIIINQYSRITGTPYDEQDQFSIIYVAPFDHLSGNVISKIIRNESYKQICIKALQIFDPDIEDMMIFVNDTNNRPVEYLRHRKLGDMPISSYGDGIKKVLELSNAIIRAANGILLIDEIETSIHKKYYDDIFRFIVKACITFNVQIFVTTHNIEAIDGILDTQDYDKQNDNDDICVCTVKKTDKGTYSRVLTGREVYENREAFGFEVRL